MEPSAITLAPESSRSMWIWTLYFMAWEAGIRNHKSKLAVKCSVVKIFKAS